VTLLQTLRRIIHSSPTYASLYRGLRADTLSTVLSSFLYFLIYTSLERVQRKMRERRGTKVTPAQAASSEILIGTLAGVLSKRLSLPISAVCIRQQLQLDADAHGGGSDSDNGGSSDNGILANLSALYDQKGLLGLFHIPLATVPLALLPSLTLYFHDLFLRLLVPAAHRAHPSGRTTFILAALSNAVATAILYPMVLGKALSISGMAHRTSSDADDIYVGLGREKGENRTKGKGKGLRGRASAKDRLIGPIADVYKREGVRGCFRGVEGQLVKGFIQQGVTMLLKQRYALLS
jgi:hypothetical protein